MKKRNGVMEMKKRNGVMEMKKITTVIAVVLSGVMLLAGCAATGANVTAFDAADADGQRSAEEELAEVSPHSEASSEAPAADEPPAEVSPHSEASSEVPAADEPPAASEESPAVSEEVVIDDTAATGGFDVSTAEPSSSIVEFVGKYTGCRLKAYQAANGVRTIGYNHTGADVMSNSTLASEEEAKKLLAQDLIKYADAVKSLVQDKTISFDLTQNQFDVLTAFAFDVGKGDLKKLVKGRNAEQVAEQILKYNNVGGRVTPGLDKMRKEQSQLFLS